jgi:hypothetical protein
MRRLILGAGVLAVAAAVVVALSQAQTDRSSAVGLAQGPLATGVFDQDAVSGSDRESAFAHIRAAGATFVRLTVGWDHVAPDGATRPSGFDPRNPDDPMYRWDDVDAQVHGASSAGLTPIFDIVGAPDWAQPDAGAARRKYDGPYEPSPSDLADFATAAAKRYGGGRGDLPRVRYWQVWNEPNITPDLVPLRKDGRLYSPIWYRSMVNAMADAVHGVSSDNVVIAGAQAPFGVNESSYQGIAPLTFMSAMLCMSVGPHPKPTCDDKVSFDVWAHHPYTYGGPTHRASNPGDVSLGDLGQMRDLLVAAARAGHIRARGDVRFWVTEFSWDTNPPDPRGLPIPLQARWTAEALYRMWNDGVSLVTWFLIRDEQYDPANPYAQPFQSGLYFRSTKGIADDRPKPTLEAFRFPFVAFREPGKHASVWGRTPPRSPRVVTIQEASKQGWRTIAHLHANGSGIFSGQVAVTNVNGKLRAQLANGRETSLPFGLVPVPDRRVSPFGY